MDDKIFYRPMHCGKCGSNFSLDEVDEREDMTMACPDCGSGDVREGPSEGA